MTIFVTKETFLKARERFIDAIRQSTGGAPSEVVPGKIIRFATSDRRGDEAGWCKLFDDGEGGVFGCWRQGISETWQARETHSPEERQAFAKHVRQARVEAQRLEEHQRTECREKSAELWERGRDVDAKHAYLLAKGVKPHGLKQLRDMLMVPVRDTAGTLHGIQFIQPDGGKRFKTGTAVAGCYHAIGGKPNGKIIVCEGYATGSTIHEVTDVAVAIAFNAGNLKPVAEALRMKYPDVEIVVCADDDCLTKGNPGLARATEAAQAVGGKLAVPAFPDTRGVKDSDFNDLARLCGIEAVRASIEAARVAPPITVENPPEAVPPQDKPRFSLKSGRDLQSLNIKIDYVVEGIIPRCAVILLYGRGGIGKTTLIMMIANAIDRGEIIFGMATTKTQVIVIDFENSLAVLSERAKRTGVEGVLFLDSGQNPPSLDKTDWTAYQELLKQYPGAVFVFDTLRSSHSGDENNSEAMTLIMRRMRMLRDAGATVILLHHTPKGNDRQFKGSGAIFDLCDQTLALYQTVKPGSDQEADDDDDDPDKVYRFGTGKKTRYKPHRVFLSFDTEQEVFTLAKNPDDEALEYLHSVISQVDKKTTAKQSEIVKAAISDGGFDFGGEKKIRALLKRGTDRFWTTDRGLHNSIIYRPIQFGRLADPIGAEKLPHWNNHPCQLGNTPEKQVNNNTPQSHVVVESGRLADTTCQTEEIPFFDLEEEAV